MAFLPEPLFKFLSTLSEDERRKYLVNNEEDVQTKMACTNAGLKWDQESESAAIRYLRNLKKRKELAATQQLTAAKDASLKETKLDNVGHTPSSAQGSGSDFKSSSRTSSPVESEGHSSHISRKSSVNNFDSDSDNDSFSHSNNHWLDEETDSVYEDCRSVASTYRSINQVKVVTEAATSSSPVVIKKFPESSFRKLYDVNFGGLFSQVQVGRIRGQLVKKKTFPFPMKGITPNCEKVETIRKIFQLEHRNLIPMLGMIDVGINECPQWVYTIDETEMSLLQYLRSKDKSDPKGYATFGKFSLDIISACEYLHTNGIVHGFLSAGSVIVRRAYRHYGKHERKLHLNSFLGDYGIIQLTDVKPNGEFYKASNGKTVHLRWSPKEILLDLPNNGATCNIDASYSFQSDIWSFGVVLWQMWTCGNIPYGKGKPNSEVEKDILDDCSPLTFEKPQTCPRHVLDVMKSVFAPVSERPSFLKLKQTFEEFRKYKYEHNKDEKQEKEDNKFQNEKRMPKFDSYAPESPALLRYQRLQEWKSQSTSGASGKPGSFQNDRAISGIGKANVRKLTSTSTGFCKRNASKPKKVAVVCVPMLPSGNGPLMTASAASADLFQSHLQNQVNLAQALATLNVATRQAHALNSNSGSNSVNVNISREPNGNGAAGGNKKPTHYKKCYYNKKKGKGNSSKDT